MYFKRIEMHGFKSFAEPVVIEFHEGVTCIVGPNGSGKSNISDAIRWVLGEQSPKALRGGKMEEVIFSGTTSRKSRGMAEVTLVIDNSTEILPIDYNEVAITRRMYRSGESEYLINNNQCRLKDIRELIMDTGIGVDGYSLIGQGKIADIVSNKPESRREIFEEAAGVVLYKSKKHEAERKLSSTTLNLERANDIIGEIESRIDGLKEESIKAKETLSLREKRRDLEINITLRNVEKFSASNESGQSDVEQLTIGIEELTREKEKVELEINSNREKIEVLDRLTSETRDKLIAKVEEIGTLTNKTQLDKEKLASIKRDRERLEKEIEDLNAKLEKELEQVEAYETAKKGIEENQEQSRLNLESKINLYHRIVKESLAISEEIENDKNKIMELHRKVSEFRSEVKSYESYRDSLSKRRKEILDESNELEKGLQSVKDGIKKAEEDRLATEKTIADGMEKIKGIKVKETILFENQRNLSKKGEDLRIRLGQLRSRRKTISEMEANYEGYHMAVKYIMRHDIEGIEGVVAELMQVPAKYEVAIETALGGSLQNIVCKRDRDAKNAINLLKRDKAGRVTFLPIESINGKNISVNQAIHSARGFEGIGSNLISFHREYDGIFKYLLGRVAIVDNMDTAVQLSKIAGNGLRFVTLDGEIINAGGAITGGRYKNSTANLLSRKNEIDKLTLEITSLKSDFEKNQNELTKREEEGITLRAERIQFEEVLKQLQVEMANLDAKIRAMKESSQGVNEHSLKRERELSTVEVDIKSADELIAKAMDAAEKAEREINSLELTIEEKIDGRTTAKAKVEEANEEITQARLKKTELDGAMESQEQLLSRVLDMIDDYTEQIEEKEDALEELDKLRGTLGLDSGEVGERVNCLIKEKEDLEAYIEQADKERQSIIDRLRVIEKEQHMLVGKMNSFIDQKQQQEIKMARNEANLETAKQKLWEDFEISYAQALQYKKDSFVYTTAVKESREIKNRLDQLGDINVGAIKEYEEVKERYTFLTEQRQDIVSAMDELKTIIRDMDRTIKSKFKDNFDKVVVNFEETFTELFGGGHAELRLDDEEHPLEAGIEIIAQPPGKKLQNINLMSGGEKTMTAIALMFAVLKTKPTPFCILDEVEAALDDANIDRFAQYLRKFNEIQFAIVTHQKVTMEHADVLYGVTMPEQGVSKILSLRLGDEFDV